MSSAILVAILAGSLGSLSPFTGRQPWGRYLALGVALTLLAGTLASLPNYKYAWGSGLPDSYTGPISLVEQDIAVHHPFLSRVDVWLFVSVGSAEQADIFIRLTPQGEEQPVRESAASVRSTDWSEEPVAFTFAPLAESRRRIYRLSVGVLGPPSALVRLGLTGNDPIPESSVIINGEPTRWANDLSMYGHWEGRGARVLVDAIRYKPTHLVLLIDLVLTASLWILAVILRPWRAGSLRSQA